MTVIARRAVVTRTRLAVQTAGFRSASIRGSLPPASTALPRRRPSGAGVFLAPLTPYIGPRAAYPLHPHRQPETRREPPTGPDWLHEIKFDGFRIQLHKRGRDVRLFSRNGKDFTDRFPLIPAAVLRLPVRSAAIDGELVACDGEDKPDFYALMRRPASGLCVWCFDLLMLNGRDLRPLPLEKRKAKLSALLAKTTDGALRLSHTFGDGEKLLHAAGQNGLEGIVSKRRMSHYVAGTASGWIKVKTAEWREANRERYKLFEKT